MCARSLICQLPVIFILLALVSALLAQQSSAEKSTDISGHERSLDSDSSSNAAESALISPEPRQYFRVSKLQNNSNNKKPPKKIFQANSGKTSVRRVTSGGEKGQQHSQQQQSKISNATLKKLLNQALLKQKSSNATGSGGQPSNFKFVFIQRATAAPTKQSSLAPPADSAGDSSGGNSALPQQPSLAASVSKQLASSLFNSAASLVGDLSGSGSAPSLSSLASQIISQTLDAQSSTSHESPGENSISSYSASTLSDGDSDTKRILSETTKTIINKKKPTITTSGSKKNATTKSRPSKIYNLPVKFVSNGQPNHVVFNTIKQHFATIKRLQSAAAKGSTQYQQSKRRKQGQAQKFKGNSRLIYLPLKYLSNARPSRLIIGKASHKSLTKS